MLYMLVVFIHYPFSKKTVREATYKGDPAAAVNFDLLRVGTAGDVTVQWRLNAEAGNDFEPPLSGIVQFGAVSDYGCRKKPMQFIKSLLFISRERAERQSLYRRSKTA